MPSWNRKLLLSNLKDYMARLWDPTKASFSCTHLFSFNQFWIWLPWYIIFWAGMKFRAIFYYTVVHLQSRRASPSIRLPDAQEFTNPLAITSAFQGFHKKCNSCESLKCLLKQWLTLGIITPFALRTGWSFPCGFMLLEGILDNLWLFNPSRPWEQCKCGWMKCKVFLLNSENSYPSGAPSFPRVSVICCQNVQETFEEKYLSLGWGKLHVSEVHKQV